MKLVTEFTGRQSDIGKKLPMEIPVRKGLDRYGCETSENTLCEFSLVIATVAKVSRKRGLGLVVRVNKRIGVFYRNPVRKSIVMIHKNCPLKLTCGRKNVVFTTYKRKISW